MKTVKMMVLGVLMLLNQTINAQESYKNAYSGNRPDGHAPISIMADHYHSKGGFMVSYRYMHMNMNGLLNGSNSSTNNDAHNAGYMVTPIEMPMQMHMLGVMYAPSDNITLLAMANIIKNDMRLQMRMMGMRTPFNTASSGFGDVKLGMIYKFLNRNKHSFHGNLTVSLPTGSISERAATPMSAPNTIELPYPMQLGSGTFDTNLGLTYRGQKETFSWGSQLKGTLRIGENKNDYAFGNRYNFNNWLALKATDWLSISGRLEGVLVDKIRGENSNLTPMMVTTADTANSGGTYVNSGLGFNVYVPKGSLKNLRVGFEYAYPLYQKPNGIQLALKETITVGLQYAL